MTWLDVVSIIKNLELQKRMFIQLPNNILFVSEIIYEVGVIYGIINGQKIKLISASDVYSSSKTDLRKFFHSLVRKGK